MGAIVWAYFVVSPGDFVVRSVMSKVRYFTSSSSDVDDCIVVILKVDGFIVVGSDVEGGVDSIWVLLFNNRFKTIELVLQI